MYQIPSYTYSYYSRKRWSFISGFFFPVGILNEKISEVIPFEAIRLQKKPLSHLSVF